MKVNSINDENGEQKNQSPKIGYMIIDYERLSNGNPTVKPVFHF